jgi:glutamine amidotransferase
MKTVIVKYNAGNVRSVLYALERLGVAAMVTDDEAAIRSADRVIFPGVGEASSAMAWLRERGLDRVIAGLRQPVLGICLGMQLMCESSEEGEAECLGIFPVRVARFDAAAGLKVPQMGWNDICTGSTGRGSGAGRSPLFEGLAGREYVYFVHGYYAPLCEATTAVADYGGEYSAALGRDNFHAVQFHPERSGAVGNTILRNFISGTH